MYFLAILNGQTWTTDSLDHLEQCSVELSKDLIAVLQFKADVVGLHPSDVLEPESERQGQMLVQNHCKTLLFYISWVSYLQ